MEKIKDPAMILSITNSVGLVGAVAYFYKRLEKLEKVEADLQTTAKTLQAVLVKMRDMEKGDQQKGEVLHTLNGQVKLLKEQVDDLPIEELDTDLAEIVSVLGEHEITVDLPSQVPVAPPPRRGSRAVVNVSAKKSTGNNSARNSFRGDSSREVSSRSQKSSSSRREASTHDDDTDLISAVRGQT